MAEFFTAAFSQFVKDPLPAMVYMAEFLPSVTTTLILNHTK